jgi:hypothetical protein
MKEKDIRDRITRFLQKTARTVVVPASMGLGLSAAGCDRHSLHGKAADAGPDLVTQNQDAATNPTDLADAATRNDLPLIAVPYLMVMVEDAAADVTAGAPEAQSLDADRDAFALPADAEADMFYPPPAYLYLARALREPPDGAAQTSVLSPPDDAQGTAPGPVAPPEEK